MVKMSPCHGARSGFDSRLVRNNDPLVKRLTRITFYDEAWVRFPYGLLEYIDWRDVRAKEIL